MDIQKILHKEQIEVEKNYFLESFISKENDVGYSIVRTRLNGTHPLMKNVKSNRTYYILDGHGTFLQVQQKLAHKKAKWF